ncbi:hypothetical protein ASC80_02615 [Afipia sp. Root123D2]|uniref:acyl carrier protein n=1 Tax=Afipia sp. Root123D2 TaxID=1736436 RepID=UPI0006F84842|nr:acyl carrier protein [Afipia sp. Root123D2]KQW22305.1 hypothetical protein ASC80_02615 [Afipia sp. Root123D2]
MSIDAETVRTLIGKLDLIADPSALIVDIPLNKQGLDSLDFVNLLFRFEEDYEIKLPDSEVDGVKTINDIVALVNMKLARK